DLPRHGGGDHPHPVRTGAALHRRRSPGLVGEGSPHTVLEAMGEKENEGAQFVASASGSTARRGRRDGWHLVDPLYVLRRGWCLRLWQWSGDHSFSLRGRCT